MWQETWGGQDRKEVSRWINVGHVKQSQRLKAKEILKREYSYILTRIKTETTVRILHVVSKLLTIKAFKSKTFQKQMKNEKRFLGCRNINSTEKKNKLEQCSEWKISHAAQKIASRMMTYTSSFQKEKINIFIYLFIYLLSIWQSSPFSHRQPGVELFNWLNGCDGTQNRPVCLMLYVLAQVKCLLDYMYCNCGCRFKCKCLHMQAVEQLWVISSF